MTDASRIELLLRGVGRRNEFLQKKALAIESAEQYQHVVDDKSHKKADFEVFEESSRTLLKRRQTRRC